MLVGEWMRRILIIERQAIIASDLAEGLREIFDGVEITRSSDLDVSAMSEGGASTYDLALVSDGIGFDDDGDILDRVRLHANRVIRVGTLDDPEGSEAMGIECLPWPFTDDSLRNLINRITAVQ